MSRFDNLEFGKVPAAATKREIVKDEAYYFAEADGRFRTGNFDLALRGYSKVLEYNPANQDAWTYQVRMLIELGELREAKLWADKALERFPIHPELLAAKAVSLARMADPDSALAFSDAAIEERGNTPYVWLARGDVLLARREARASYCFDQALNLARADWLHTWLAARIHSFYASFALALRYAQQAADAAPDRAVVWLQAGVCQLELGLDARARESLERARELDAECPGLGLALQKLERISFSGSVWRRMKNLFS
jgi:tetratricopeptide (TPR) repeat protein